jgi:CBS domain-containing protein
MEARRTLDEYLPIRLSGKFPFLVTAGCTPLERHHWWGCCWEKPVAGGEEDNSSFQVQQARQARAIPLRGDQTMAMTVGQVMNRPVLATTASASAQDIAPQLVAAGISGMPVADRDGTVVGVVTEYDLVDALVAGKQLEGLKACDIMSRKPITLDAGADLGEALRLFEEKHIIRIAITEEGKLVGILSRADALRGILDEPEFLMF